MAATTLRLWTNRTWKPYADLKLGRSNEMKKVTDNNQS